METNDAGLPRGCKRKAEMKTNFTVMLPRCVSSGKREIVRRLQLLSDPIPCNDNVKKLHQLQYSEIVSDTCGLASVSAVMEKFIAGTGGNRNEFLFPCSSEVKRTSQPTYRHRKL